MTAPPWSMKCPPEERLRALDAVVVDLWCEDRINHDTALGLLRLNRELSVSPDGWDRMRALFTALDQPSLANLVVVAAYALFTQQQCESLPRALHAGARPVELLVLGVHGLNCDGEDLVVLDDGQLRGRMEKAIQLGQAGGSVWLRGYTGRLVDHWRERRGHGTNRGNTA